MLLVSFKNLLEKVLPLPKDDKENQTKRRVPPKKEEKDKKTELVKKEAVMKLRLEERKAKRSK